MLAVGEHVILSWGISAWGFQTDPDKLDEQADFFSLKRILERRWALEVRAWEPSLAVILAQLSESRRTHLLGE